MSLQQLRPLRIALGVIIALGLGAARSEKVWSEILSDLGGGETAFSQVQQGHAPFDPRRVPQSGGMASRLLAGIVVKHA